MKQAITKGCVCVVVSVLAACVVQDRPSGIPRITVSSGNFTGFTSTVIFVDGTVETGSGTPQAPVYKIRHTNSDAFIAAAKVIAADGPKTRAALKPAAAPCLDYGTDVVRADPPIAGFDQVAVQCPDPAVAALMSHVLSAIALP